MFYILKHFWAILDIFLANFENLYLVTLALNLLWYYIGRRYVVSSIYPLWSRLHHVQGQGKTFKILKFKKNFDFKKIRPRAIQIFASDSTGQASSSVATTVDYFSQGLEYTTEVKKIVDSMAEDIEVFVQDELERFNGHRTVPLSIIIVLGLMVPIIVYITYLSTTSMFQYVFYFHISTNPPKNIGF